MIDAQSDGPLTRRLVRFLGGTDFRLCIIAIPAGNSKMDFAPNSIPQIRLDPTVSATRLNRGCTRPQLGVRAPRLPALNMMMRGILEIVLQREPGTKRFNSFFRPWLHCTPTSIDACRVNDVCLGPPISFYFDT